MKITLKCKFNFQFLTQEKTTSLPKARHLRAVHLFYNSYKITKYQTAGYQNNYQNKRYLISV